MNVNGLWVEMDVVIQLLVYRIGGGDYVYIIVSKLCVGVNGRNVPFWGIRQGCHYLQEL